MSDFVGDRKCVTHHCACDCREALTRELVEAAKDVVTCTNADQLSRRYTRLKDAHKACEKAGIGKTMKEMVGDKEVSQGDPDIEIGQGSVGFQQPIKTCE